MQNKSCSNTTDAAVCADAIRNLRITRYLILLMAAIAVACAVGFGVLVSPPNSTVDGAALGALAGLGTVSLVSALALGRSYRQLSKALPTPIPVS